MLMTLGKPGELPLWFYLLCLLVVAVFLLVGVTTTDPIGSVLSLFFGIFMLGCLLIIVPIDLHAKWTRKKAYAQFEAKQKAKGLVKFVNRWGSEKWGTPKQVFVWQQLDRGLVKYDGEWITLQEGAERQRIKREKFEREQIAKGLVKYKGRWMTPEKKYEREMLAKGLVKYKGKWVTPEEKRKRFEEEQRAKGFVKFMGRWGTPKQVDKWKKLYTGLTSDFMDRSPKGFEEFIAELFTRMGYSASTTPYSHDYGADVIAKKGKETIAVQVKRYEPGSKVGVKDVNQVLGSMYRYKADRAILVTTSRFTRAARKLAGTAPVELWNRVKLYENIERYFFGESSERSIMAEISSRKREAIDWFNKGCNLFNLGSHENEIGRYEDGISRYEDAIEATEWGLELIKSFEGEPWEKQKKLALGTIAEAWNNKGTSLAKLGRFKEAIKCFDKALGINPELQIAQNNKTIVQEKLEKRAH